MTVVEVEAAKDLVGPIAQQGDQKPARFERRAEQWPGAHVGVVELVPGLPPCLRVIHRRVGVAQDLFSVSCINGYGFDLELLYVAQRRGYRIAEIPINWADQPGSKVRVVRDGIGMLRELMAIPSLPMVN